MIFGHERWRNMGCIHFNQHTYYLLIDGWPKWQHNRAHLRMMYEGRFENLKFLLKYKFFGGGECMVFFVLVLTRKVHLTPNTQQAEQSWLHTRKE
jgi:hypothetical protein